MSVSVNEDSKLWGVDRSWSNYRGNANGDFAITDQTKYHIDRGDTTAKCSPRILLNSLQDQGVPGFSGSSIMPDMPAGTVGDMASDPVFTSMVCRRCVPRAVKP